MSRFTLASAAVLATLIAAACGQSTTAVPPASTAPGDSAARSTATAMPPATAPATLDASVTPSTSSPAASPTPSPAPTSSASGAGATLGPGGSGEDLSGYADLRALLPDKVGEVALTKSLFTGEEFESSPESVSEQMRALLKGLGRGPRDLAMAIAGEQTGAADLTITAFRVRDIQADEFFAAYVPLVKEAFPSAAINETVLGGKTVYDVSLDGQTAGTTFLYPRDDVLFIVTGSDLELVNLAFAALP